MPLSVAASKAFGRRGSGRSARIPDFSFPDGSHFSPLPSARQIVPRVSPAQARPVVVVEKTKVVIPIPILCPPCDIIAPCRCPAPPPLP